MGLEHKVETGNIDGLREWVSAGIQGRRLKKFDGLERERVEEVGAAMLVGTNEKLVRAQVQVQVHECKTLIMLKALQSLINDVCLGVF